MAEELTPPMSDAEMAGAEETYEILKREAVDGARSHVLARLTHRQAAALADKVDADFPPYAPPAPPPPVEPPPLPAA